MVNFTLAVQTFGVWIFGPPDISYQRIKNPAISGVWHARMQAFPCTHLSFLIT